MTKFQRFTLALLRIGLGVIYLYAGITKLVDPSWSAAGYIKNAKTFATFYMWLATPEVLPVVNFLNTWGLMLVGLSLVVGLFVRLSSFFGIMLMVLYYFPILAFPYVGAHSWLVDEHITYSLLLLLFIATAAGRYYGLDAWCAGLPICRRSPRLRRLFG